MRNYQGIVVGAAVSVFVLLTLTCLITALVAGNQLGLDALGIITPIVHFTAIIIGCTIAGRAGKDHLLLRNGIVFAAVYVLVFALNLLVFDDGFAGAIAGVLAGTAGFGTSLVLAGRKGKGSKKRYTKRSVC